VPRPLHALLVAVALPLCAAAGPPAPPPAAAPAPDPAAAEVQAARAIAAVSAGEPTIEAVQDAAAREADRTAPAPPGFAGRARLAAFLPRFTAEYRHDQSSNRTVGLQGSGEVDYLHVVPSDAVLFRATWDLGALIAAPGELAAATHAQTQARRRAEAMARVTELFFERRRLRAALLLAPPSDPVARAQSELAIDRLGAEINALTGARGGAP
jgi:hypothetical protein